MKISNLSRFNPKNLIVGASAAAAALGSSLALAVDDAAVTAAYTAGTTSVTNATTGLIGLCAVIVGVGMIIMLLKKG